MVKNCANCFQHMFWCCFSRLGTFHQFRCFHFVTWRSDIYLKFLSFKSGIIFNIQPNGVCSDLFHSNAYLTWEYEPNWCFGCCHHILKMLVLWPHLLLLIIVWYVTCRSGFITFYTVCTGFNAVRPSLFLFALHYFPLIKFI